MSWTRWSPKMSNQNYNRARTRRTLEKPKQTQIGWRERDRSERRFCFIDASLMTQQGLSRHHLPALMRQMVGKDTLKMLLGMPRSESPMSRNPLRPLTR